MGIRLIVEVLDHAPSTLTHREFRLLFVLAEDANDETRVTWHSIEEPFILRRSGLSRSQFYVVLKALVTKATIERATAGQKHSAAKYRLLPLAGQCPAGRDAEDGGQRPEGRDTELPQRPVHRDTEGKFSVPKTGTLTESQRPEERDTDESQCPAGRDVSVPLDGTPTPLPSVCVSTDTPARAKPAADSEEFTAFWKAYPRAIAKGQARKAFAAALKRQADPQHIATAASRFAEHHRRAGTEPRYIPYPATWLNGERYDDEPEVVVPQQPAHQSYADRGVF